MLHDARRVHDIDIAVLCQADDEARAVRRLSAELWMKLPIHLFLLTLKEEMELGFLSGQACRQFYPVNDAAA